MPIRFSLFIAAAIAFRLGTLWISRQHEKALKASGAVELGRGNTFILTLAHTGFYAAAIIESFVREPRFDLLSGFGVLLYSVGAVMLVLVIRLLGRLWTVKLILAPNHSLVTHALFRHVRHPNYYLAIVPELIGFALALHAFGTLCVGLLLYAYPLSQRISMENRSMGERFPEFRGSRREKQAVVH